MKVQIIIEADFDESELDKLKYKGKRPLPPTKGEYLDTMHIFHDNGIGKISLYNPLEYNLKNHIGISANVLSNVKIVDTKIIPDNK